jgi:alkylated DNA nucleotide flippase Atl1
MDKKTTAVDWLINELQKTRDWQRVINEANQSSTSARDVIAESKEMEREQIINAFNNGENKSAQLYYNETYGGNK